mgnify:CR=1 FL=1
MWIKRISFWFKQRLLWLSTPFQKVISRMGHQEPDISPELVNRSIAMTIPGDIILTYESGRPTSRLIPGPLDHAAIVTNAMTVMEAVPDKFVNDRNLGGVREVKLEPFLYRKNQYVIIRPVYLDKENVNMAAARHSFFYQGRRYDHQFNIDNENIYCSELVYLCYRRFDNKFMEHISIYDEILPDDYLKLVDDSRRNDLKFEIVFDTRTI